MSRTLCLLLLPLAAFAAEPPEKKIPLFNGNNLEGLHAVSEMEDSKPEETWTVEEGGVLACSGYPKGYIRTTEKYRDYRLRYEWRWPGEPGNNGVLLHIQEPDEVWPKSIEGQGQHGHAGDIWVIGGATFKEHPGYPDRRVVKSEASTEKPLGEWNQYIIICKGDTIRLYVNGVLQNTATECTVTEGYIGWQSEGAPIEFRNITIEPLEAE